MNTTKVCFYQHKSAMSCHGVCKRSCCSGSALQALFAFVIFAVIFLQNLLIAQLTCSYQSVYEDRKKTGTAWDGYSNATTSSQA
eukprot:6488452-Amphidinium_carterae.1